jgi:hypothetical protein
MTNRSFEEIMRAAGAAAAKVKRSYLSDPPDNTSVVLSLDAIELGALDLWIEDQSNPKPTRQEAARRPKAAAPISLFHLKILCCRS